MSLLRKVFRISLLITAAAFIGACASSPPRTASEIDADRMLEQAVKQQLVDNPNIYAKHIEVSSRNGVVTLGGFVLEARDLFEAQQIAARVPGVTSVKNQMELEMFGRGGKGGS